MARRYELKQRAVRQQETRERIVEAAIELHRTKGPAHTTLSDVARLAGVQRHTLYRYFPTDRDLFLACSGTYMDRNPPPDPEGWLEIEDRTARLRHGLTELYTYFERNDAMFTCVVRDAEFHNLTREMFELRAGDPISRTRRVLARGYAGKRQLALIDLAVDFRTWQRLSRSGLARDEAVELMVDTVGAV
jgi:AcrR family transcriptional regulator